MVADEATGVEIRRPGGERWIVVADSPFLPAEGGGEKEHLGFVEAAVDAGLVAALVVPTDRDPAKYGRRDDLAGLRRLVAPAAALFVPRNRTLRAACTPWRPYVVGSRPPPKSLALDLRAMAPDATAVVVFSYKSHHLGHAIARRLGLPALVRMHNLEGRYQRALAASAQGLRSWAWHLEATRVALDERRLERAPWVRALADISAADARVRATRATVRTAFVPTFSLRAGRSAQLPERRPSSEPTVVFVGALDVPTNHDAIAWFSEQVWPLVSRAAPEARWLVVGRRPPPWLRERLAAQEQVELHADVPDPGLFLRAATVAVNPAVSGSGVNIKLVEYLATGAPVVTTSLGVQGLPREFEALLDVEDDPAAFAESVVRRVRAPDEAQERSRKGQQLAAELLDGSRSLQLLVDLLHPDPE